MAMARTLVGRAGIVSAPGPSGRPFCFLPCLHVCSFPGQIASNSPSLRSTPVFSHSFSRSFLPSAAFFARSSSVSAGQQTSDSEGSPVPVEEVVPELSALDIRVGKILKAWKHPSADSLYVEEVDVGEESGPRTICSGLVKYIPEEELQGRSVIVLANLKARNMRGTKSEGMLMAASDAAHENVELLTPPDGAVPGERAWFGSEEDANQAAAATPNQLQKKKIWETIQPLLSTTDECVATFRDKPLRVPSGLVTCKSLKGANVS